MMAERKPTRNAGAMVDRLIYDDNPERQEQLARVAAEMEIAEQVYLLRTQAGLSQRELARLVGTSQSAIARLESADYQGHSLSMLRRIAAALGKRVCIHFEDVAAQ